MPGTYHSERVTSLAEVWIEMLVADLVGDILPVTSLAEVWIEIVGKYLCTLTTGSHFPCGSVD